MNTPYRFYLGVTGSTDINTLLTRNPLSARWEAETFMRVEGGIRYLRSQHRVCPSVLRLYERVQTSGMFSPRPYQLGQAFDGTIGSCVMALFARCCEAHVLHPLVLLRSAYPTEVALTEADLREMRAHADWQGVAYPQSWNAESIGGLQRSLAEIGYHSVIELVDRFAEFRDS